MSDNLTEVTKLITIVLELGPLAISLAIVLTINNKIFLLFSAWSALSICGNQSMKKSDFGVVSVIYAIGLGFLWMTLDLPAGAQTYPLVLITALLCVNTTYLIRALWAYCSTHYAEDDVSATFKSFVPTQFIGVLAWCISYLVLMYVIGYYLSTIIFMVGTMLFLRVRPFYIFLSVVVIAAMVAAVFSSFLHVPLPTGMLF